MLKQNKPLLAKKQLKATTGLKSKTKLGKTPKHSVSKLKKQADAVFSKYVRYRDGKVIDGQWFTQCITSGEWIPIKKAQAGHFMSRRYNATRYEEENVNGQSYRDNVMFNGEQYKYALAIDLKYGDGTAKRLAKMAKESHPFTIEELQQIIQDSLEQIKYYESNSVLS